MIDEKFAIYIDIGTYCNYVPKIFAIQKKFDILCPELEIERKMENGFI
jgi:uncharacterized protein (DUF4213/DUF364 family)